MNYWTDLSIQFANQRNYLDELYKVYPISPNIRREINENKLKNIETFFNLQDNVNLIKELLTLDLFPIKDSYVAYLRRDPSSITRNPQTINRIAGNLYNMGLDEIYSKCMEPKETNRQIGPMFKNWINKRTIGVKICNTVEEFLLDEENAILNVSDSEMQKFSKEYFNYDKEKGLDFIARFSNKYIIAEAKFITDFGGHQNGQFADAMSTMSSKFYIDKLGKEVIPIAIMDGVLYINKNNKLYKYLQKNENKIIISSLLLREFLYSI